MLKSRTDTSSTKDGRTAERFRVGRVVALSMEDANGTSQMNDLRQLRHADRSCRMTCCRACGGAVTGLSVGVLLTFVVASLRMSLTLAQTLVGFFAVWLLGALLGAVIGALCHRHRSPSCARIYAPKRVAASRGPSSAPVPVVISSVAATLALLLLVIPSFPQEKLVSVAWLVMSLIHPQVNLPAGYCKSMNATQEHGGGGGGGGGTQGISNRRRLNEASSSSSWASAEYQTPPLSTTPDVPKVWSDAEAEAAEKVA